MEQHFLKKQRRCLQLIMAGLNFHFPKVKYSIAAINRDLHGYISTGLSTSVASKTPGSIATINMKHFFTLAVIGILISVASTAPTQWDRKAKEEGWREALDYLAPHAVEALKKYLTDHSNGDKTAAVSQEGEMHLRNSVQSQKIGAAGLVSTALPIFLDLFNNRDGNLAVAQKKALELQAANEQRWREFAGALAPHLGEGIGDYLSNNPQLDGQAQLESTLSIPPYFRDYLPQAQEKQLMADIENMPEEARIQLLGTLLGSLAVGGLLNAVRG